MYEFKKFDVLSVGLINCIMTAVIGLILGIFYALIGAAMPAGVDPMTAIIFSPWMILVLPIIYGILGFIGGIIFSAVYNLVSNWIGGIKVELKKIK